MQARMRLILLSFLMLFVELVLIRWAGANIVYLSYFSNFVLLGSFLGIGIGFLRSRRERDLSPYAVVALAGLVVFVLVFQVRAHLNPSEVPAYFDSPGATGLPIWVTLPLIFAAVAGVMALIGEWVARTFKLFEPLEAYRLDILGSLLGVVAFSVMSFLSTSPVVWGAVVVVLFVALLWPHIAWYHWVAMACLLVALGIQSFGNASWSPYYRIETHASGAMTRAWVNGRPHQFLATNAQLQHGWAQYWAPFQDRANPTPPQDMLIIGAGTGVDAQVALSEGVEHIDAVEIDPGIYKLGLSQNPERPYSDPRVSAYITDGRAFLENTDNKYDLISVVIPDSLTLIAGNAGVRLESYLMTREAIQAVKEHLAPGGVFVFSDFFREVFAVDRMGVTLRDTFLASPCEVIIGSEGHDVMFLTSNDPGAIICKNGAAWQPSASPPAPSTDDHPFPYIEGRVIPGFYLASLIALLLISFTAVRASSGPFTQMLPYTDLFFMGAGFLLLETKNVVQFALLFGTTWFVNALVFGGVLLTVLAAIETTRRTEFKRPGPLYVALFSSLAVAWVVSPSWLLPLPYGLRFLAAVLIAFAPLFLANLVFARRFSDVGTSTVAFGANLLGAILGGVLEYAALIIGYRGLTILAAALYGCAWLFGRRIAASPGPSLARNL